ncbi:hypothetical protein Tco_0003555, partial [Tanacetum coccineum]
ELDAWPTCYALESLLYNISSMDLYYMQMIKSRCIAFKLFMVMQLWDKFYINFKKINEITFQTTYLKSYALRIRYQQFIEQAGSPALHETNADGGVDDLATHLDSGDTLETLFVAVGVLAILNLGFATTDVALNPLDFTAIGEVNKALLTQDFLVKALRATHLS